MDEAQHLKLECLRLADGNVERAKHIHDWVTGGPDEQAKDMFERGVKLGRAHSVKDVPYHRPVGANFEEWRADVRKTELYQRGDTVLVWVNEGDLCFSQFQPTQYEIEAASPPPPPTPDTGLEDFLKLPGAVRWMGGECPVPDGTTVVILRRDALTETADAEHFDWGWEYGPENDANIIAYRPLPTNREAIQGEAGEEVGAEENRKSADEAARFHDALFGDLPSDEEIAALDNIRTGRGTREDVAVLTRGPDLNPLLDDATGEIISPEERRADLNAQANAAIAQSADDLLSDDPPQGTERQRETEGGGVSKPKPLEITSVVVSGEVIPIHSPELDDFCNEDGDLVMPDGKGKALVIPNWRDTIRKEVTKQ